VTTAVLVPPGCAGAGASTETVLGRSSPVYSASISAASSASARATLSAQLPNRSFDARRNVDGAHTPAPIPQRLRAS
jgi:hypothetical protein